MRVNGWRMEGQAKDDGWVHYGAMRMKRWVTRDEWMWAGKMEG